MWSEKWAPVTTYYVVLQKDDTSIPVDGARTNNLQSTSAIGIHHVWRVGMPVDPSNPEIRTHFHFILTPLSILFYLWASESWKLGCWFYRLGIRARDIRRGCKAACVYLRSLAYPLTIQLSWNLRGWFGERYVCIDFECAWCEVACFLDRLSFNVLDGKRDADVAMLTWSVLC